MVKEVALNYGHSYANKYNTLSVWPGLATLLAPGLEYQMTRKEDGVLIYCFGEEYDPHMWQIYETERMRYGANGASPKYQEIRIVLADWEEPIPGGMIFPHYRKVIERSIGRFKETALLFLIYRFTDFARKAEYATKIGDFDRLFDQYAADVRSKYQLPKMLTTIMSQEQLEIWRMYANDRWARTIQVKPAWIADDRRLPSIHELINIMPASLKDGHPIRVNQAIAWVRHKLTNYDRRIGDGCSDEVHETLKSEANQMIRRRYPELETSESFNKACRQAWEQRMAAANF